LYNPEKVPYASAREVNEIAGVNLATVTCAAQTLGFSGCPERQKEICA